VDEYLLGVDEDTGGMRSPGGTHAVVDWASREGPGVSAVGMGIPAMMLLDAVDNR